MANITKNAPFMELPLGISRQVAAPIERFEVFYSMAEAEEYALNSPIAYVGQSIKVVDEATGEVTAYIIKGDGTLKKENIHQHNADDIIETVQKKFVSQAQIDAWNDKPTQQQLSDALKGAIAGMEFKGTFPTLADLPTEGAQDGWYAIVTDEPTAEGKNLLCIYEKDTSDWKSLGELLIPGVATVDKDGLMGKDHVKTLNQHGTDLATHRTELDAHQTKLDEHQTTLGNHQTKLDEHQTTLEAHKTELDQHTDEIQALNDKFIMVTTEQIDSLFNE